MPAIDFQKRALAALKGGNAKQALAIAEKGLKTFPDAHFLHFIKGSCLVQLNAGDEAVEQGIEFLRVATVLAPAEAAYHFTLSTALAQKKRFAEALLSLRHSLRIRPKQAKAALLAVRLLLELDRPDEARDCLLATVGGLAPARLRFNVLLAARDFATAKTLAADLLRATDADEGLLFACASLHLATGDFSNGWDLYAKRRRSAHDTTFDIPLWQGEALEGKTILVAGEQGLGDEIMFSSVTPDIIAEAKRVVVACRAPLVELFTASMPGAIVRSHLAGSAPADISDIGKIDYRCLVGDLARYRRRRIEDFRGKGRYVDVPAQHVKRLRAIMTALAPDFDQTINIGLVWATGSSQAAEALKFAEQKSIPPRLLQILGGLPEVRFFSLQNVNHAPQAGHAAELDLVDLAHHLPDFIDTAAALKNLSLLITVDTAQAHLAGALGVPCWILLPPNPDWRWGTEDPQSYWYPSVRLFRRGFRSDWSDSLRECRSALEHWRVHKGSRCS